MQIFLFIISTLIICISGVVLIGWLDVGLPKYRAERRIKKTIKEIMKG
jgi:hypothetical protein